MVISLPLSCVEEVVMEVKQPDLGLNGQFKYRVLFPAVLSKPEQGGHVLPDW